MDTVLGRLLDYLKSNSLYDNTYIFFAGDNGSELFEGEEKPPNIQVGRGGEDKRRGWVRLCIICTLLAQASHGPEEAWWAPLASLGGVSIPHDALYCIVLLSGRPSLD